MTISEGQAKALNALTPGNLNAKLGDVLRALGEKMEELAAEPAEDPLALIHLTYEIVSDLSGGLDAIECLCDLEVLAVLVQARSGEVAGTVALRKGTSRVSGDVYIETDNDVGWAPTIDDAYSSFDKGQYINLITENSGDRALVTVVARRI